MSRLQSPHGRVNSLGRIYLQNRNPHLETGKSMQSETRCFLCDVPKDLVFAESTTAFALCGLGPIMPGYSLVATKSHVASAADVTVTDPTFVGFAEAVRSFLGKQYGNCLLTEHGRMPACVGPAGEADPHCFHAHFLLFPAAPEVLPAARQHFSSILTSGSLADALHTAREQAEYLLISPSSDSASILLRPGRLIPQFARMLVAQAIGKPELTNWRKAPSRPDCVQAASFLRNLDTPEAL